MFRFRLRLCTAIFCLSIAAGSVAAGNGDALTVLFSGQLLRLNKPCTVNDNKEIRIEFGKVGIHNVADGEYIRDISYALKCSGIGDNSRVYMTIHAPTTGDDALTLRSDTSGLGVRILREGQPLALNTAIEINPAAPPHLQAQLVADPKVPLVPKAFTASGSLIVEYL